MLILIALGRRVNKIRDYEREQHQKWWNRHTEIVWSVSPSGFPTNSAGDEDYNLAHELYAKKEQEHREFQAGQKERDLTKSAYFLAMLLDVAVALALFFYYL